MRAWGIAALAALALAAPSHQAFAMIVAGFDPIGPTLNIHYGKNANGSSNLWVDDSQGQPNSLAHLYYTSTGRDLPLPGGGVTLPAQFSMSAGSTSGDPAHFSGLATYIYSGSSSVQFGSTTINPGAMLFSAHFQNATLSMHYAWADFLAANWNVGDSIITSQVFSFVRADRSFDFFQLRLQGMSPVNADYANGPFAATGGAGIFAPVPEPAEWAMLLLGLGVVGAILRKKRAGASAPTLFA